jgi:hypothetical protein
MMAFMRLRLAIMAFSLLLGMTGALVAASPASASTSLKGWMLAQGEYDRFTAYYGKPIPVQWVTCSFYPAGNPSSCPKRRLIRETNYFALVKEINQGRIQNGDSVLADYETWSQTPRRQQAHPEKYICLTDALAAKHHLFLIQSPWNPSLSIRLKEQEAAASCAAKDGTNEVTELQYQGSEVNPARYVQLIRRAVRRIRALAKNARMIGGLATDLKNKAVPMRDILRSYQDTKHMLIGYWLNCNTKTAEGVRFFEDIGAIPAK